MSRRLIRMTIDDVDHYTPEQKEAILEAYPAHERQARAWGVPALGSGRVFPVSEESLKTPAFAIPRHWALIGGLDFGWDHPFAAVLLAWDRDADCLYVVDCYRIRNETPLVHAGALKAWGEVPWAWPHDGLQTEKGSGRPLADSYRGHGLQLLSDKATHAEGGFSLEAGIMALVERMRAGRFKVFDHLSDWFEEFRTYHRKDGKIVKERDDLMSATRIAHMMLRYARTPEDRGWDAKQRHARWVV
ncbi:MAG: terminase family protein [Pseudomonadota bacterium]